MYRALYAWVNLGIIPFNLEKMSYYREDSLLLMKYSLEMSRVVVFIHMFWLKTELYILGVVVK